MAQNGDAGLFADLTGHLRAGEDVVHLREVAAVGVIHQRVHRHAAGRFDPADIDEPITLKKGDKAIIPTGIAIGLDDPHFAAFVYARSGLAIKHGIGLLNSVGVIDSDYRGEICVGIIKQTDPEYTIEPFERIAQMVIEPVELPDTPFPEVTGSICLVP